MICSPWDTKMFYDNDDNRSALMEISRECDSLGTSASPSSSQLIDFTLFHDHEMMIMMVFIIIHNDTFQIPPLCQELCTGNVTDINFQVGNEGNIFVYLKANICITFGYKLPGWQ